MSPPPSSFLRDARLLSSSSSSSSSTASFLAESQTTEYDGYQQAWRLLGYFVDCQSASAQEENGNEDNNNNNNSNNDGVSCQRYLLWAAYIDPNYQGLGVSEYQYYDATRHAYDPTACQAIATDSDNDSSSYFWNKCPKKMDCHESHTDFQLLGVFKEPYYASAWVPTLLQHQCGELKQQQNDGDNEQEGDNNENTAASSAAYQALTSQQWPEACTATGKYIPTDSDNDEGEKVQLYVDLQASVTAQLALYVDSNCQTEYVPTDSNAVSQDKLAADLGLPTAAQAAQWNEALRPYYYCQPCVTHDLSNAGSSRRRRLEEENNAADYDFACYDAAGEVNANQCAAFAQNSGWQAASWHDLNTAIRQGSLAQITVPGSGGTTYGLPLSQLETAMSSGNRYAAAASSQQQWPAYLGLVLSGLFCLATATFGLWTVNWKLGKRQQRLEEQRRVLAEPLVTTASF